MPKFTLTLILIFVWLGICQAIFHTVQKSQATGYEHLISGQAREIIKSSDYFKLSQTISDLTNLGFIRCPDLKMTFPISRQIIDLYHNSECRSISTQVLSLTGTSIQTNFAATNGDQYQLRFTTINPPIFTLSLWAMRLSGAILILMGLLYLKAQQSHQEELIKNEIAISEARYSVAEQLAHDIRSPLSALSIAASSLPADLQIQRDLILQTSKRVNDIAEDMLKKSKQDPQIITDSVDSSSLSSLRTEIENLVKQKNVEFKNKKVHFLSSFPDFTHKRSINIRTTDVLRILSNLCNNAVESLSADGTVKLEGWVHGTKVCLRVSDTGSGIPEEILTKIGTGKITSKGASGNGLGLFHAKKLLQSHKGDIHILSKIDVGTQITLSLPLKNE